MVGSDVQPVLQVEPVRFVALHTGVEVELFATLPSRLRKQPVEELLTVATKPHAPRCYEVIHVEEPAPRQALGDAESGHGSDGPVLLEDGQPIAVLPLLSADTRDEFVFTKVRAQVVHQREAAENVVGRL